MNRAAHWLRDSVILLPWYVAYLADQDAVGSAINRPWHGLQLDELVELLHELFLTGDLAAIHGDGQPWSDSSVPTRPHIRAVLLRNEDASDLCYALTPQGGRQWEAVAHPDWNQFADQVWHTETHQGEKLALTRAILTKWIAADAVFSQWAPIRGTEVWTEVAPWPATYWKTFPQGHCVRYRYRDRAAPSTTMPDSVYHTYTARFRSLQRWYIPIAEVLDAR